MSTLSGPEDCPVHDLAATDPGATVQIYDDEGRYLFPMSAEMACSRYHLGGALLSLMSTARPEEC